MPFFQGALSAIRRSDLQRYVTERSGKASSGSIIKEVNVVKHLLRLSVEWEIIPVNPAQGMKMPKAPAGRLRYLHPGELRAIIASCPEWLRPLAIIAANTGMRRSEILGLRPLDIDLRNGRVILPQTKNGTGRIVYLNRFAQEAVAKALPKLFTDYTPAQVSVSFKRVCRTLGIQDFHFHDLRHTAASWLRMAGADIHTVAQILGHKDLRMAARYQHLSPEYLASAVKRLELHFEIARIGKPMSIKLIAEVWNSQFPKSELIVLWGDGKLSPEVRMSWIGQPLLDLPNAYSQSKGQYPPKCGGAQSAIKRN